MLLHEYDKIQYTFINADGEEAVFTPTLIQVEGAVGGFIKQVKSNLEDEDFGTIVRVERKLIKPLIKE